MKHNSPGKLRGMARYLNRLLAAFLLVALTTGVEAQNVTQYTFGTSTTTWSAISGGTRLNTTTSSFDNQTYTIDPTADVLFAGTYYDEVYVSANGFITFNAAPSGTNYTPISNSSTGYAGAVSAFGCDVANASSGTREIRWQEVGSEVVIQWLGARRDGESESISFQIRLNTSTGVIRTIYNASTPSTATSNYPEVGLRGANNSTYNNRAVDVSSGAGSSWANSAAGDDNDDVCRYNNTTGRSPANGLTFTWTPPCLPPTTAAAGADQTICIGGNQVLAANTPSVGTGAWSILAGSPSTNLAQLSSTSSPTATLTPTGSGTYTLRWTISNGVCTASFDDVVITVRALTTTANAGSDQTVCASPGTATLAGNTITSGTGTWTKTSPGAGGSITTPGSPTSGITGLTVAGSPYTFRWTATNAPCASNFDEMIITVIAAPTTSNAGTDQTICITDAQVLAANVPSVGTGAWSINAVSGGATNNTSQFSSLSANNATFTPLTAGTYTLRWTISNGVCTASVDDMILTVRAVPTTANAGSDQTVCASPGTATLAGNTITSGTGTWTKTSPGAGGSITTPGSPTSGITGLTVAGSPYTFRWTATNAPCASNFDEMIITVIAAPTTSNAGTDQTICITDAQVLAANVPSVGTGAWSINAVSGGATNNTSQFSSLSANNATFTPLTAGTYTLRWTISNGVCTASVDDMILTVRAMPTTANAGPDQAVCANPGTATLAGNTITSGSGTWTKTSPGAGGSITTPGSPTTGITGLTVAGSPYTFRWTATNSPCASNFDEMTIVVNPHPTATPTTSTPVCVGSPLTLNGNTNIGTSYAWSGPNGFASASQNPSLGNATLAMGGTYSFTATSNGCPTTGTVSVGINPVPANVTANSNLLTVCSTSNSVNLTSSTATTATLLSEGWNSGAGGWTTTNTSTGGTVADAAWTIRPNNYAYNASSGTDPVFNSNDNTSFFLTNSDDQGSGTTATTLTSPAFSTVGYNAVSLSYYHHYRFNSGATDRAFVEVSTDNSNWTTLTTYSSTQGAVNGFVQATANLNSVAGQPTVYVRFRYGATFDWWWAVDNVNITGTFSTPVSYAWTSTPSGFTSASQNPSSVAVTQDRTYTVTVTSPAGCTAQASVEIDHVQAPVAGSNNSLTVCSIDAAVNMGALLGTHDAGSWSGPSPVSGDLYNPATMNPGNYVYTVSAPPCANATATISVTENTATPRYADVDGDGFGDAGDMVLSCSPIAGRVSNNSDCNDNQLQYADGDGDGFGAGSPVACGVANNTDCNDAQLQYADGDGDGFGAGAPVACGVANNTDCNDAQLQYADGDGDGFGAGAPVACGVANNTDCNDAQLQYTDGDGDGFGAGAPVACGVANNTDCNDAQLQYADGDGDGFGAGSPVACGVANNTDCNDAQLLYVDADGDGFGTGAPVPCGVADNTDCNDALVMYADGDGDGFGAGSPVACGGVVDNSDCNDAQLQYTDGDGDGFGAGAPVACGVANNSDCNDAQLQYADADGDGFGAGSPVACGVANNTDNCPAVVGLIGSNCDAQAGPGFVLGQLNGSCACVAIACTQNVVLELRSDANSDEIGWEILDQNTNLVICSGGAPNDAFPSGITTPITESCCLPVGCYRLRVSDAGGDGFVSGAITGGYQLRESGVNGRRIIDNMGNFAGGSLSTTANTYENGAFCVPIGNDRPIFTSCDKLDWVANKYIVATENTDVSDEYGVTNTTSGYEFWFFDPNGSYSFRRFRNHATSDGTGTGALRACHFRINGWVNTVATPHIPANVLLNVRIRGRVAGVNQPFGPACLFKIDPVRAACPLVKLQDNPSNTADFSCGVSRTFGGTNNNSNKLVANPPQFSTTVLSGDVRYQFRFRLPGEYPNPGSCIVRPIQSSPTIYLNWLTGDKLRCGTPYKVDVRVSKDGGATWCVADGESTCSANPTVWGKVCTVNITTSTFCPGGAQNESSNMMASGEGQFNMFPNPNNGDQLVLSLTAVEEGVNTVNVDIYDMTGKRVMAQTIPVQDGFVKSTMDLNGDLQSGMYVVNVTAGTKTVTERLVIQH